MDGAQPVLGTTTTSPSPAPDFDSFSSPDNPLPSSAEHLYQAQEQDQTTQDHQEDEGEDAQGIMSGREIASGLTVGYSILTSDHIKQMVAGSERAAAVSIIDGGAIATNNTPIPATPIPARPSPAHASPSTATTPSTKSAKKGKKKKPTTTTTPNNTSSPLPDPSDSPFPPSDHPRNFLLLQFNPGALQGHQCSLFLKVGDICKFIDAHFNTLLVQRAEEDRSALEFGDLDDAIFPGPRVLARDGIHLDPDPSRDLRYTPRTVMIHGGETPRTRGQPAFVGIAYLMRKNKLGVEETIRRAERHDGSGERIWLDRNQMDQLRVWEEAGYDLWEDAGGRKGMVLKQVYKDYTASLPDKKTALDLSMAGARGSATGFPGGGLGTPLTGGLTTSLGGGLAAGVPGSSSVSPGRMGHGLVVAAYHSVYERLKRPGMSAAGSAGAMRTVYDGGSRAGYGMSGASAVGGGGQRRQGVSIPPGFEAVAAARGLLGNVPAPAQGGTALPPATTTTTGAGEFRVSGSCVTPPVVVSSTYFAGEHQYPWAGTSAQPGSSSLAAYEGPVGAGGPVVPQGTPASSPAAGVASQAGTPAYEHNVAYQAQSQLGWSVSARVSPVESPMSVESSPRTI